MWIRSRQGISPEGRQTIERLRTKKWANPAERDELIRKAQSIPGLPPEDITPFLLDADAAIRNLGLDLIRRAPRETAESCLLSAISRQSEAARKKTFESFCALQEGPLSKARIAVLLADRRPAVVGEALEWVRMHPDPGLLPLLRKPLSSTSPALRRRSIAAVEMMSSPEAALLVADLVQDEDEEVRLRVAKILASNPSEAILHALMKAAADLSPKVAQAAGAGLKTLLARDPTSWRARVIPLLGDPTPKVREFAVRVLSQQDPALVVDAFLETFRCIYGFERDRAIGSLLHIADRLIPALVARSEDPDPQAGALSATVAVMTRSPLILGLCVRLLKSPDWWLRQRAADSLSVIRDERALPNLIELLGDRESNVMAAAALGNWGDPKVLPALSEAYKTGAQDLRCEAIDAIARVRDTRVPAFLQHVAQNDPEPEVRDRARRLVGILEGRGGETDDSSQTLFPPIDLASKTKISLEDLLHHARSMDASDLHLAVGSVPHLRIHGTLVPLSLPPLKPEQAEEMVLPALTEPQAASLKAHKNLDFCYKPPGLGRFRSNVFYQRKGLDAVFRLIPTVVPTLADIGIPESLYEVASYTQGLVLITGSAGSGKTSTLAAFVDRVNRTEKCHILTIEDPVEYVHRNIESVVSQREVPTHTASFAKALRQALREDPDVIMVGELRDLETISLAMTASETGHLVFGTLHTTTAGSAVDRIIDSFPADQQSQIRQMLADSLKAVIAQILLPRRDNRGRAAAFEILRTTTNVSGLIRDSKTHQIPSAIQTGLSVGMQSMDAALLKLVSENIVDPRAAYDRAIRKEPFEPFLDEEGAA
jgi:twitching motility protein PilT